MVLQEQEAAGSGSVRKTCTATALRKHFCQIFSILHCKTCRFNTVHAADYI
jgi:hypothetical protein